MSQRVLILEDQPDGVALLMAAVQASFHDAHITIANDLATARHIAGKGFDYALVDLRLPDGLSIDWLAQFKADHPGTVAIVTSLYDDDDLVFAALRAGADGYLLKGDGQDSLAHSLAKVLQGEPPISPPIARKLMEQFRAMQPPLAQESAPSTSAATPAGAMPLTVREEEVLTLIGSGLMIKQVAAKLGIGYHTVNDNIKAIYRKLGIRTRAEAAAQAAKRGLVSPAA
jgi:two-component system, NarL family, nitrate/nitrite response regulator NarL